MLTNQQAWYQGWPVTRSFPGHKGRPGEHGGSSPRVGVLTAPKEGQHWLDKGSGADKTWKWLNKASGGKNFLHARPKESIAQKVKVARDLSETTGMSPSDCSRFVAQWAESSNDDDMRSLAIQRDAATEFGVKTSVFTQGKIEARLKLGQDDPGGASLFSSDKQRVLLRAMYDKTQAELKTRGITEIRVARGIGFPKDTLGDWKGRVGKTVTVETNALESWSLSVKAASNFAVGQARDGKVGVVMEATVPARRVLALPTTGFGCLREGELVVIGGIAGDQVSVWDAF